jgi:hypothetical protein
VSTAVVTTAAIQAEKTLPFKMIPVIFRDYLRDLSGNELKVWLYQYLRSGKENTSYPKLETIAHETGLNRETVKDCRRSLIKKGMLKQMGRKRNPDGTLGSSEYEAVTLD